MFLGLFVIFSAKIHFFSKIVIFDEKNPLFFV